MVVASDPDVVATGEFRRVFPERQTVLLLAEAHDPLSPEAVAGLVTLERAVGRVAGAVPFSAVTIAERMRPGIGSPDRGAELRRFLGGTPFFRRQGLLGDDFLGLAVELDTRGPAERGRTLAGIERALEETAPGGRGPVPAGPARGRGLHERVPGARDRPGEPALPPAVRAVRGGPDARPLPLVARARRHPAHARRLRPAGHRERGAVRLLVLDRLVAGAPDAHGHRHRLARLHPLALRGPARGAPGGRAPALGAREQAPAGHRLDLRRRRRLRRPRRLAHPPRARDGPLDRLRPAGDLGLLLHPVPRAAEAPAHPHAARARPRRRVAAALGGSDPSLVVPLAVAARARRVRSRLRRAAALFGVPGLLRPMPLETDPLDYIPAHAAGRRGRALLRARGWRASSPSRCGSAPPDGSIVDPAFLAGLDEFATTLERDPRVGSVTGLPAVLRLRRYAAGQGDAPAPGDAALRAGGGRPRAAPAPGAGPAQLGRHAVARLDPVDRAHRPRPQGGDRRARPGPRPPLGRGGRAAPGPRREPDADRRARGSSRRKSPTTWCRPSSTASP